MDLRSGGLNQAAAFVNGRTLGSTAEAVPDISTSTQLNQITSERDVTLERLSREPFIETDPSWTTRMRIDSAFAAGPNRRITCQAARTPVRKASRTG